MSKKFETTLKYLIGNLGNDNKLFKMGLWVTIISYLMIKNLDFWKVNLKLLLLQISINAPTQQLYNHHSQNKNGPDCLTVTSISYCKIYRFLP